MVKKYLLIFLMISSYNFQMIAMESKKGTESKQEFLSESEFWAEEGELEYNIKHAPDENSLDRAVAEYINFANKYVGIYMFEPLKEHVQYLITLWRSTMGNK